MDGKEVTKKCIFISGLRRKISLQTMDLCAGGTGSNGTKYTIANGKVQVPDRVWKIAVVNTPGAGASGVTTSTRVISVDMPNDQGIRNNDWRTYRVSVDSIEVKTGFNFLSNVSTSVQSVIESRVDNL